MIYIYSDIKDINNRIKLVRKKLNLKQKDIAESLGIKQGHWSDIERGVKKPSETLLIAFIYRYAISYNWLIKGEGEMFDKGPEVIAETIPEYIPNREVRDILNKISSHLTQHPQDVSLFKNIIDFLTDKNITFMLSDLWMGRILEDLIDILVKKNIISEADISHEGWQKILQRRMLRRKINMEDISIR